jgi:hypothetical protein
VRIQISPGSPTPARRPFAAITSNWTSSMPLPRAMVGGVGTGTRQKPIA